MKKIVIFIFGIVCLCSCSKLTKPLYNYEDVINNFLSAIETGDTLSLKKAAVSPEDYNEYLLLQYGPYKITKIYSDKIYSVVTTQFENGDTCRWEIDRLGGQIVSTAGLSKKAIERCFTKYNFEICNYSWDQLLKNCSRDWYTLEREGGSGPVSDSGVFDDFSHYIMYVNLIRKIGNDLRNKKVNVIKKHATDFYNYHKDEILNGTYESELSSNETILLIDHKHNFDVNNILDGRSLGFIIGGGKFYIEGEEGHDDKYNRTWGSLNIGQRYDW